MSEKNDYYTPPEASLMTVDPEDKRLPENSLRGLGGWLTVLIIWLIVTLLGAIWNLVDRIPQVLFYLKVNTWCEAFLLTPMVFLKIFYMIFLVVSSSYLLLQMKKKSAFLPKLFIYWLWITLLVRIFGTVLTLVALKNTIPLAIDGGESMYLPMYLYYLFGLSIAIALTIIWVIYFKVSVRVKNTFVY